MVARPSCFAKYSPLPAAPCTGCRHRGPCAYYTETVAGFGLLHRPRLLPKESYEAPSLPDTSGAAAARVLEEAEKMGFVLKGQSIHPPGRLRVAFVATSGAHIALYLASRTPREVADLPGADKADLATWRGKGRRCDTERKTLGTLALFSAPEGAIVLLQELTKLQPEPRRK